MSERLELDVELLASAEGERDPAWDDVWSEELVRRLAAVDYEPRSSESWRTTLPRLFFGS